MTMTLLSTTTSSSKRRNRRRIGKTDKADNSLSVARQVTAEEKKKRFCMCQAIHKDEEIKKYPPPLLLPLPLPLPLPL